METPLSNSTSIAKSRQAAALGAESTASLEKSRILIIGLDGVGVETAKNLILSGIGHISLHDSSQITAQDLSTNFCIDQGTLGEDRANASLCRLNDLATDAQEIVTHTALLTPKELQKYSVVLLTSLFPLWTQEACKLDSLCREAGVPFLACEVHGLVGCLFADLGSTYSYENAPPGGDYIVKSIHHITQEEEAVITVSDFYHQLGEGDRVSITGVDGMSEINGKEATVHFMPKNQLKICLDTTGFSAYTGGGVVRQVPVYKTEHYRSLEDNLREPQLNRPPAPTGKGSNNKVVMRFFQVLGQFWDKHHRTPMESEQLDFMDMLRSQQEGASFDEHLCITFLRQLSGDTAPMHTLFGGFMAQEAMKVCMGRFTPLNQWMFFESLDCAPEAGGTHGAPFPLELRYQGQANIVGPELQQKLMDRRLFVVGSGALGCEFLKCFSLMGVGCGNGRITVTDQDEVAGSNLHRQLLFRSIDVGKFKAVVAAASCNLLNPKVNVQAHTLEVSPLTTHTFHDMFWEDTDEVIAAVDNIKAREYLSDKSHIYNLPFLDSGTRGLSCSTSVILPFRTQEFQGSEDPEAEINCTGNTYPFRPLHTITWAKHKFHPLFYENIQLFKRHLHCKEERSLAPATQKIIDTYSKLYAADAAVRKEWAMNLLKQYLVDDTHEVLSQHPANAIAQSGEPFWTDYRKCPHPIVIDSMDPLQDLFCKTCNDLLETAFQSDDGVVFEKDDPMHVQFTFSLGNLFSRVYGIPEVSKHLAHRLAGNIMPALLTTTAIAVGLTCLELLKVIQRKPLLHQFKNHHMDTASWELFSSVPSVSTRYDPMFPSKFIVVNQGRDITLQELVAVFKEKFFFNPFCIRYQTMDIYHAYNPVNMESKVTELLEKMKVPLHRTIELVADLDQTAPYELIVKYTFR